MFRPLHGTFFNIALNLHWNLHWNSFASDLYSELGCFTRMFYASQLIVLAMFDAMNQPLSSCMLVHRFANLDFEQQFVITYVCMNVRSTQTSIYFRNHHTKELVTLNIFREIVNNRVKGRWRETKLPQQKSGWLPLGHTMIMTSWVGIYSHRGSLTFASGSVKYFWRIWVKTLGRDEMAAISQTTLSDAFSGMKMYEIRLRIHWSLFLRFELTIFNHWFR